MMVLYHLVGQGNAHRSLPKALEGFRNDCLSKMTNSYWHETCVARSTIDSFGAEHSNRSLLASEFQIKTIDAEAFANV